MISRLYLILAFLTCTLLSACAPQHDGGGFRERDSFNPFAQSFASRADSVRASWYWYERGRQGESEGGEAGTNTPDYYERAIELNPRNADAMVRRTDMLLAGNNCDAALISANQALRVDPKNALLWAAKARVHWRRSMPSDQDTTMSCYDQALRLDPKNAPLWKEKGLICLQASWKGREVQSWYEESQNCFALALRLNPKDAELWQREADVLQRLKRPKEAATAYRQVMRLDRVRSSDMLRAIILVYEGGHDTTSLLRTYREAQKMLPKAAWVWNDCGTLLCACKRYDEGLRLINKAIVLDPKNSSSWGSKADALSRAGRVEEALSAWDRMIAADTTDARARGYDVYGKGKTLFNAGRYAEAEPILLEATQLYSELDWAWFKVAIARREMNRPVELQLAALDSSLAHCLEPLDLSRYWAEKARALKDAGRMTEALAAADSAIRENPTNVRAWEMKAWILALSYNYYDAIECCDSILAINPDDKWALETRTGSLNYLRRKYCLPTLDDTLHKSDQ